MKMTLRYMQLAIFSFFLCKISFLNAQSFSIERENLISRNQDSGKLKCEPSCIITDKAIVVTWNDSHGGYINHHPTGTAVAWAISYDQGKNFHFGGYFLNREKMLDGADSWLVKDTEGNIYLSCLS